MSLKAFYLPAAVAVCISFFCSCKKSDDSQSRESMLTGQWTLSRLGTDANRNGTPDSGELVAASAANQSALVNFRSNKSYTLIYTALSVTDTFNGSWSLVNNESTIRTIFTLNSGNVADTSNLRIYAISSNTLTVLDESDSSNHVWELFVK